MPSLTPHQLDIQVRFFELDGYGHVNHSVYVQYFEAGRVIALDDVGMGLDVLESELGLTIVVVEIHTRFVRSAKLADNLVVESGLSTVGRVKATWLQRIMAGDELIATQRMVSGSISTAGKPVRFPAELMKALEVYHVDDDWI